MFERMRGQEMLVKMVRDFSERDKMNAEYLRHFDPRRLPARLCYGNVDLADSCKIEIAVIAIKK